MKACEAPGAWIRYALAVTDQVATAGGRAHLALAAAEGHWRKPARHSRCGIQFHLRGMRPANDQPRGL